MRRESEVILEVEHVTPEDVFAWGGFAGTVEQLRAAAVAEGKTPTEISKIEPELQKRAGLEWWLSEEPSKALALRMAALARQRYVHPPPLSE